MIPTGYTFATPSVMNGNSNPLAVKRAPYKGILFDTDIDLTDEQFSYLRALEELERYTKTVTADESENRAFVLSAIDYLKRNYKDEL